MLEAINDLLKNAAFWVFLGTLATAYYGYKAVARRYPIKRLNVTKTTSFEELRAVVEVLQGELIKKDKRHREDTNYLLEQLREARNETTRLATKLADSLKDNADLRKLISELQESIRHHENRLNKAHIPFNGDANEDKDSNTPKKR